MSRRVIRSPERRIPAVPLHAGTALHSEGVFMNYRGFEFRSTAAAFGMAVPFTAVLWLFAAPNAITPMTLIVVTLLAMGAATVTALTWRNGQATRSIGHVLHDEAALPATKRPAGTP